jgi:hypothetical protein
MRYARYGRDPPQAAPALREIDVWSFNPLLSASVTSNVHNPVFDNWESIT